MWFQIPLRFKRSLSLFIPHIIFAHRPQGRTTKMRQPPFEICVQIFWSAPSPCCVQMSVFELLPKQTTFLTGHSAPCGVTCDGTFDAWDIFETGFLLSVFSLVRLVFLPRCSRFPTKHCLVIINMGPVTGHLIKMVQNGTSTLSFLYLY